MFQGGAQAAAMSACLFDITAYKCLEAHLHLIHLAETLLPGNMFHMVPVIAQHTLLLLQIISICGVVISATLYTLLYRTDYIITHFWGLPSEFVKEARQHKVSH